MSRAGSSSHPAPHAAVGPPTLCIIIGRFGPPLPSVTDLAAGDTDDERMTHAEACNEKDYTDECMTHAEAGNEKDGDYDDDDNRKNNKKKDPPLILEALDAKNAEDISLNRSGGLKCASNAISTGGCGMERL